MLKTTPRRNRHVSVRFTQDEYAKLEAQAQAAAIELSSLIRKIVVDTEIPNRARRRSADIVALGRTLAALNRIGSNINQIAKEAHVVGDLAAYHAAQAERAVLAEAARAVMAALAG